MIPTHALSPHLAEAVKKETTGQVVRWVSRTGTPNPDHAARWIWLLAIPATAYMLLDSWNVLQKLLAAETNAAGSVMFFAGRLADLVWTLLWTALAIAALFVPAGVKRTIGDQAHVVTETALMLITATPFGTVSVETTPIGSVMTIDRVETADNKGTLTVHVRLDRRTDGASFRKSYTLTSIQAPRQVEDLIKSLSNKAGAKL